MSIILSGGIVRSAQPERLAEVFRTLETVATPDALQALAVAAEGARVGPHGKYGHKRAGERQRAPRRRREA